MVQIDQPACAVCGGCVGLCPEGSLSLRFGELMVNRETCTECNLCVALCPVEAIAPERAFSQGSR